MNVNKANNVNFTAKMRVHGDKEELEDLFGKLNEYANTARIKIGGEGLSEDCVLLTTERDAQEMKTLSDKFDESNGDDNGLVYYAEGDENIPDANVDTILEAWSKKLFNVLTLKIGPYLH